MFLKLIPSLAILPLLNIGVEAQTTPAITTVLNRISAAYRNIQTYRDTANWTNKLAEPEMKATVNLTAQRPGRYLLEIQGEKVNTLVVSDGSELIAYRPDRKAFTRTRAPQRLIGSDLLGKVDIPAPGAKIISLFLQGNLRNMEIPLAKRMTEAELKGIQSFGGRQAYVLQFPYDEEFDARVYVTVEDNLIRRVVLYHAGEPKIIEDRVNIEIDRPVAEETFRRPLPEGAKLVTTLPPLEYIDPDVTGPPAPDFMVQTAGGESIQLSQFKGKVVLLNFFFNDCPPCQEEFPHLVKLYNTYRDRGFEIISVNVKDTPEEVRTFMNRYQARFYAAINGQNDDVAKLYGVEATPTNVVINRSGRIISRLVGLNEEKLDAALKKVGIR
jgi:peroxiredoxin/outer membrane lipoprotein-sorting protein